MMGGDGKKGKKKIGKELSYVGFFINLKKE